MEKIHLLWEKTFSAGKIHFQWKKIIFRGKIQFQWEKSISTSTFYRILLSQHSFKKVNDWTNGHTNEGIHTVKSPVVELLVAAKYILMPNTQSLINQQ